MKVKFDKYNKNFFKIKPILIGGCCFTGNKLIIISTEKTLEIMITKKEVRNILTDFLPLCNGTKTIEEIIQHLKSKHYHIKTAIKVARFLFKNNAVIDSRELYLFFHKSAANPTLFYYDLLSPEENRKLIAQVDEFGFHKKEVDLNFNKNLDFIKLITKRQSIRNFDVNKTMPFNIFSDLLYSAYGISEIRKSNYDPSLKILRRVVPGAGALYPLHIFCIVYGKIDKIDQGIYYFLKSKNAICKVKDLEKKFELNKIFPNYTNTIKGTPNLILVIVCNFYRIVQKYSNRGYIASLLEAGHVLQNLYLYCAKRKLAIVELLSFHDKNLSKLLEINYPHQAPLITAFIGYPA